MAAGNPPRCTVALTGATGFLGGHVRRLLEDAGFPLRLLARDPGKLAATDRDTVVVPGSLSNGPALRSLVEGAEAVVHCAGAVRGVTRDDFDRVNAIGAGACARAAAEAGVRRFLLISSLAAREPRLSPYAASKRAGEHAVRALGDGMSVTVFRPPGIYGPGDVEMLPIFRTMARGIAPVFGPSDARFSLVYAEDVASAVLAWLDAPTPPSDLVELDDGKPGGYSWTEVCHAVSAVTGRPVRQVRVPGFVLGIPAALNWLAGRVTGHQPMLTPGKLRELRHADWVCSGEPPEWLRGALTPLRLADGLARTPGWRKDENERYEDRRA